MIGVKTLSIKLLITPLLCIMEYNLELEEKFRNRPKKMDLWYQSNINCSFLFITDSSRKLSEVPPISIVKFNFRKNFGKN